ncbi:MAG: bifunctional acetate--CoA ligase family protein/GNAT family N-acetyltransferase [Acidobacteriota bacterium]|nr:bifunctional acetate--CoA ligase family protein/GNAT family N-acetyltransferase [Acidobacteriota bacterium]
MNVHNLDCIFKPERIALVGVSTNPNSVGGKVLTNLVGSGFRGVVYPVNPRHEAVMAMPCFPDLESLPRRPDLAVICTPAAEVAGLVGACGAAGIPGIIIMSSGFREIGAEGRRREDEILAQRARFPQMRIIGPNCLGVIVPELKLNVSFAPHTPRKGHIAFISQSGALGTSVLDWAQEENIGFSAFVSIGNTIDVDYGHLIDYFGDDENTRSILLYIESLADPRKFMTASRSFARSKPIIVYKAGRFPESAAVAASHTGALAAEDDVYNAAFRRSGLARVFDIGEIFDCAELIARNKVPKGSRLAIVTNAGGPGVMATDALMAANGRLARLSEQTVADLDEQLPPQWSRGNPVDVLGDARSKRLARAVRIVAADKGVDAVLVILTPQAMTNPTRAAAAIAEIQQEIRKPILASWLGGHLMRDGVDLLNENGIPTYKTPEQAVRAFMTLVEYARNLETLYETPRDIPVEFSLDRKKIKQEFRQGLRPEERVLSEVQSKQLLSSYGIPVTLPVFAADEADALEAARTIGYPVVFKIHSPDITHKSDVGGVVLDIRDERQAADAYHAIMRSARERQPGAHIEGVTIQKMALMADARELILGIKKDAVFGTVILVGAGGVTAELFADRSLGFPPLNERLARRMLEDLRIWPLLRGYRGKSPVNLDRLIEAMIRLSYLAADSPEILELDINPLLAGPEGILAVDARMVVDPSVTVNPSEPYAHLALRPYPEEYVSEMMEMDGLQVRFRPIRPEDEPMWMEMLASCSKESIYSRFRYFFQWASHEVATRYCYIDYHREIAIVAETTNEKGEKRLIGVGRLIADPEHETVEYAILIIDEFQNRDLGGLLTDYCIDIARKWGLKKVVAQTTADNHRMLALFKKRGFAIHTDSRTSTVDVEKTL